MAKTVQHKPGDDSIAEVEPKKHGDVWMIRWRWWPYDGSKSVPHRHQGKTKGEARAKALAKAAELRAGLAATGPWTKASKLSAYIDGVSRPAIEKSTRLAESSKPVYYRALANISAQAGAITINEASNPDTAVRIIESIAAKHGAESGRTARNVLSRWVYGRMVRSRIIAQSPLFGADVEYGEVKTSAKPANDVALSEADYDRLLTHLLGIDPTTEPRKPRSRDTSTDKRQAVIDLTLLQMTTGIRLGSARQIEPHEIIDNRDGGLNVFVPRHKLKGGEARNRRPKTFTVLDERAAKRIRQRRDATPQGAYLFGSPADPTGLWDRRNCTRAIERFYTEMAETLGITELEHDVRSHGWRTTLNSIYYWLPPHVRADWFGHSESVNEAHYIAEQMDLSPMVTAARERRARRDETDGVHTVTDDAESEEGIGE